MKETNSQAPESVFVTRLFHAFEKPGEYFISSVFLFMAAFIVKARKAIEIIMRYQEHV
jgi:hypothetical protein